MLIKWRASTLSGSASLQNPGRVTSIPLLLQGEITFEQEWNKIKNPRLTQVVKV